MFGARADALVEAFEIRERSSGETRGEGAGRLVELGFTEFSPML